MSIYKKAFISGIARVFTLPRLSIPLIMTLGLTLGAVLSVIAISSTLLYQPLKGVKNEQSIQSYDLRFTITEDISASFWNIKRLAQINIEFKDLGLWAGVRTTTSDVNIDDISFAITHHLASNTIQDVLGTQLIIGEGVNIANPAKYVWISNSLWQQAYASQDSAIGSLITYKKESFIIAGVLEDLLAVASNESILPAQLWQVADLTTSLATTDSGQISNQFNSLLLKTSDLQAQKLTEEQIKAWMTEYVTEQFEEPARFLSFMASQKLTLKVVNYREQLLGESRPLLMVLGAAVIGLLLMATLNLLNLFIAHYQSRNKELAVQLSMGASLFRLRLMILLENLPSFVLAAISGLLVTGWIVKSLPIIAGNSLPMIDIIAIDTITVVCSFMVIGLLAGLFSSLALIDIDKQALANNLNGSGKGVQGQGNHWLSRSLMVIQLSLASILLTGSVMLATQSYEAVYADLGFEFDNTYHVSLNIQDQKWRGELRDFEHYFGSEVQQLQYAVGDKVEQLVPNAKVAIHAEPPLSDTFNIGAFRNNNDEAQMIIFQRKQLSANYFDTFGITVLAGANLTQAQIADNAPRVVIDTSMAKLLFPNKTLKQVVGLPIIGLEEERTMIVNGVVEVITPRAGGINSNNPPAIYTNDLGRQNDINLTIIMPSGKPLTADMLAQSLSAQFPRLNNLTVTSMQERWLEQTLTQRVSLWIILTMTSLTILLAAIGVAGLTQMTTFHRKYELAIRMATGAKQMKLLQFVLKDALWMLLIGLGLGFVISVIGYKQLIQVIDLLPQFNWLTITTLDLGLVVIVLMSVILPAWKVIKADPMQALRQE